MAIGSVDTLRGTELDLRVPRAEGWNDAIPLLGISAASEGASASSASRFGRARNISNSSINGGGPSSSSGQQEESPALLKGMIRKGVPPALRCAIWMSNVVQAVHPHQDSKYWHEYRSLAKVRALDYAYENLLRQVLTGEQPSALTTSSQQQQQQQQQTPPQVSPMSDKVAASWAAMDAPTFGQRPDAPTVPDASPEGRLAVKRVLIALERVLVGVDNAPMIPTLTSILLTTMSESYAFCAIREMSHQADWYFPITMRQHRAWCSAFSDVLRKLHKSTYAYLEDRGVMDDLSPIFQDLFLGLLPFEAISRIMDIYTRKSFT